MTVCFPISEVIRIWINKNRGEAIKLLPYFLHLYFKYILKNNARLNRMLYNKNRFLSEKGRPM